VQTTCLKR